MKICANAGNERLSVVVYLCRVFVSALTTENPLVEKGHALFYSVWYSLWLVLLLAYKKNVWAGIFCVQFGGIKDVEEGSWNMDTHLCMDRELYGSVLWSAVAMSR